MLKQKRWVIPVLMAALVLIAAVSGYFLSLPQGNELPASLTIAPEGITVTGLGARDAIPGETSFVVESAFSVTEAQLRGLLEVDPPVPYALSGSGKRWVLTPEGGLAQDTVYTFRVKSTAGKPLASFAFQTRGSLLIESTYPANGDSVRAELAEGDGVSTRTGIEMTFNVPGVSVDGYFEILPEVAGSFVSHEHTVTFVPAAPLAPDSIYRVTLKAGLKSPDGIALKEDYSFSFETHAEERGEERTPLRLGERYVKTVLPGDLPSVALWVDNEALLDRELTVRLYKFPGINSFGKEVRAYYDWYETRYGKKEDYRVAPDSLEMVTEFTSPLLRAQSGDYFVPLPKTLAEGQYLVETYAPPLTDEPAGTNPAPAADEAVDKSIPISAPQPDSAQSTAPEAPVEQEPQQPGKDVPGTLSARSMSAVLLAEPDAEDAAPIDAVSGEPVQQLLQIANISVYTQSVGGDTLVWLNDPVTAGAMPGVRVVCEDAVTGTKQEGESDENGLVRLMTGEKQNGYLSVVRDGSPIWADKLSLAPEEESPLDERYYSALYTDRELYQPEDTVKLWGTVRPRHVTSPVPEALYAVLRTGWPESEVLRVPLTIGEDGAFEGTLPLSGLASAYYTLAIAPGALPAPDSPAEDGQEKEPSFDYYLQKGIQVQVYEKPAFRISVETDKEFYQFKERISFAVEAAYYDGTPLSGGELRMAGDSLLFENGQEETVFTLGQDGRATVRATLMPQSNGSAPYWQPLNLGYWISNSNPEDVSISTSGSILALPSKVAAELTSALSKPDEGRLTVKTALLDTARLVEGRNDPIPYPARGRETAFGRLAGETVDMDVSVLVHKVTYTEKQVGSTYDSVNKETVPVYEYERAEALMQTLRGRTKGGELVFEELPFVNTETESYWFELRMDGGILGEVAATEDQLMKLQNPQQPPTYRFFPTGETARYGVGEEFTVGLYNNNVKTENAGRVLCSVLQRRVLDTGVFETDTKTLSLSEEEIPGVWLAGAYFDGRHVYPIRQESVSYAYEEKTLALTVKSDKEAYRPGETAKVELTVTDADGKPAAAAACLGVVDEAQLALAGQELRLADQLYNVLSYPNLVQSSSYSEEQRPIPNTGGGGGMEYGIMEEAAMDKATPNTAGAGETDVRANFLDTAYFAPVKVGADGKATVEVVLPDNVTGWRFTAAAITEDLSAGDTRGNTATSLPFYLTPLLSDAYRTGDSFAVAVGAAGTGLAPETAVAYGVDVKDASGASVFSGKKEGVGGARVALPIGTLPAGAYTATLTGQAGALADAVELPFLVRESGLTVQIYESGLALPQVDKVKAVKYPVRVTVYDERRATYMDALSWLAGQDGQRTEILAAAYRARVLQNALRPEEERGRILMDERLETIQTESGGAKALQNGEADAALTARLLLASPTLLRTEQAKGYFERVLASPAATETSRVMAYVGMAALGEPVLLDLGRILNDYGESLSDAETLYLGAGLALLGDTTAAETLFDGIRGFNHEGGLAWMAGDGTAESSLDTTAAALVLSSILHRDTAAGFAAYLMGQPSAQRGQPAGEPYHLALLTYCENMGEPLETDRAKFSYLDSEGLTKEVSVDENGFATLTLGAAQMESSGLRTVSGKLLASVLYEGIPENPKSGDLRVTAQKRMVNLSGEPVETLRVGDRVRVELTFTFDPSAPEGSYNLTDVLPAGLRFVPGTIAAARTEGCYSQVRNEEQLVRGLLTRVKPVTLSQADQEKAQAELEERGEEVIAEPETASGASGNPNVYKVAYYAVAVLPGIYTDEGVWLTPIEQNLSARSGEGRVEIAD